MTSKAVVHSTARRILGGVRLSLMVAALNGAGLFALLALRTDGNGTVAALFPPWWTSARAFAAAGAAGEIVGVGAVPWVVIVKSDGPGLPARLRQAGAALILPAYGSGPCGSSPETRV